MIEKVQATALVNRFGNQPYWGLLTDEALGELVKAVQSAQTLEQAREAVDWLLENNEDQVQPAQIYARLRETPVPSSVKPDRSCALCYGTGFEHAWHERLEIWHAQPCTGCEYGRSVAAAHAGREAERAEKLA